MHVRLRIPTEQDWPAIGRAADASLPWQPQGNQEWLRNRMNFDERTYSRRHFVAEDAASGNVCGYGSVEGGSVPAHYRVFVVTAAPLLPSVGEPLLARLMEELVSLEAKTAWAREEARDAALLAFFRRHGFAGEREFTTDQGLRVVTLQRDVTPAADQHLIVRVAQDLTDDERAQLFDWAGDVFGVARLGLQWRRKDWHVVVESDGRPVSHAGFILRQTATVGRERLLVGGVGGVVTVPMARGRGFASAALREVERRIREDREVGFAMLFCLEALTDFYSRRGWIRISSPVSICQDEGVRESPLPAMIKCFGQRRWPQGEVAVEGLLW